VDKEDETLTTTASTLSYTLPTGVYNVRQVWIGLSTTSPYDYWQHHNCHVRDGKLRFDDGKEPDAGYKIKLVYNTTPALLTTDAGVIADSYPREWLAWEAATHAYRWRIQMDRGKDPAAAVLMNESLQKAATLAAELKPNMDTVPKQHHYSAWANLS